MRTSMKLLFVLLILCLLIPTVLWAEAMPMPLAQTADPDGQPIPLYSGPTQGFYRTDGQMLDTSLPYVFFGQADCWAMVAQGTPDHWESLGWVETALLTDCPDTPVLFFEDGYVAILEEPVALTSSPLSEAFATLPVSSIVVLASLSMDNQDWFYVQGNLEDDTPVRAFLPATALE